MDAKTSHTPGEWATREGWSWEVYPLRDGPPANGEWAAICTVHQQYDDENPHEDAANARLIAAAPGLLTALKKIVSNWDGEPEDMDEANEAIAKAEGRSP